MYFRTSDVQLPNLATGVGKFRMKLHVDWRVVAEWNITAQILRPVLYKLFITVQ